MAIPKTDARLVLISLFQVRILAVGKEIRFESRRLVLQHLAAIQHNSDLLNSVNYHFG